MTRGLPKSTAASTRAEVAWWEEKSTMASTGAAAARTSSPRSVAAATAMSISAAAAATARPIRPRAPLSRILSGMAGLAPRGGKGLRQEGPVCGLHRAERKPDRVALEDPRHGQGRLHRHRVGLDEKRLEEGEKLAVEGGGAGDIVLLHEPNQAADGPRQDI